MQHLLLFIEHVHPKRMLLSVHCGKLLTLCSACKSLINKHKNMKAKYWTRPLEW